MQAQRLFPESAVLGHSLPLCIFFAIGDHLMWISAVRLCRRAHFRRVEGRRHGRTKQRSVYVRETVHLENCKEAGSYRLDIPIWGLEGQVRGQTKAGSSEAVCGEEEED
ncbi:hypothetical protein DENSPDRAFT_652109 [Dentipellis sp. KUC8613]|nr:hypothetical protein DENSPDRAFT_652109 [Dentipellis sp. KUC8613]